MRIDRIMLDDIDPLRMFTHGTAFPDRKQEEEQQHEQQEEKQDDRRIFEIWLSMVKDKEQLRKDANDPIQGFFGVGPNLATLAKMLNRSDVQGQIREKLKQKDDPDPAKRAQSRNIKENLQIFNGKIARANQVWFRRIPLLSRIFWQIDKVNIPKDL